MGLSADLDVHCGRTATVLGQHQPLSGSYTNIIYDAKIQTHPTGIRIDTSI